MAPEIIAGFFAIGALVVLQIVLFAYRWGKYTERLNNLDERSSKQNKHLEMVNSEIAELDKKVTKIEVLLAKVFKLGNPEGEG